MFDPYMLSPLPIGKEFSRVAEGDPEADLLKAALECANDFYEPTTIAESIRQFDTLSSKVGKSLVRKSDERQILVSLAEELFKKLGFQGNHIDYFNPENNFLNRVLVHRLGSPVGLAIVFAALAERFGVAVDGISLPYHFVLGKSFEKSRIFIDSFNGGRFLDRRGCFQLIESISQRKELLSEEYLSAQGKEAFLRRLLKNLKRYYLRQADYNSAILVLRRLAILDKRELKPLGLICFDAHRTKIGIKALEVYLENCASQSEGFYLTSVIDKAFKRIHLFN